MHATVHQEQGALSYLKNTSCRSRAGPNRSAASAWRSTAQLMGAESRSPPYRVWNPKGGKGFSVSDDYPAVARPSLSSVSAFSQSSTSLPGPPLRAQYISYARLRISSSVGCGILSNDRLLFGLFFLCHFGLLLVFDVIPYVDRRFVNKNFRAPISNSSYEF